MTNRDIHKMPVLIITGSVKPEFLYLTASFLHSFEPDAAIFLPENKIITSFTAGFERILLESFLDTNYFPAAYTENKRSENNCFEIVVLHPGNEAKSEQRECKDIFIIELWTEENRANDEESSLNALRELSDEIKNETFKFYRDTLRNIRTKG